MNVSSGESVVVASCGGVREPIAERGSKTFGG